MDEIIQNLKNPKECMHLAKLFTELSHEAHRRAIELRANAHGNKSKVKTELLKVIYTYEDVLPKKNNRRTRAS